MLVYNQLHYSLFLPFQPYQPRNIERMNPMKAVVFEGQSHIPNLLYAELISWWKTLKKSNKLMALF